MRDHHERQMFFNALLSRCTDYYRTNITLTAIHPDGKHPTPSRHIAHNDTTALHDALARLDAANDMGWGAYFAVGLRRPGLTRWKRGGVEDVIALPALFVDVDDLSAEALIRLCRADPTPSCIVASGGGYHGYWWLNEPTNDLQTVKRLLRGLATALRGDRLSIAQSLRVPQSRNTKPARENAICHLLDLNERRYTLNDFSLYLPPSIGCTATRIAMTGYVPSADLIPQVSSELILRSGKLRGEWLNCACPFPERHKHDDQHPSFGFNTRTGYGFCHVCGTLLLKDLCPALGILPLDTSRKEVMSSQ